MRVAVWEIQKGIAFFLPIWVPFYGHNTHTAWYTRTRLDSKKRRPATGDKVLGSASKRYNANCPLTHWCQLGTWTAEEPDEMKEWWNDSWHSWETAASHIKNACNISPSCCLAHRHSNNPSISRNSTQCLLGFALYDNFNRPAGYIRLVGRHVRLWLPMRTSNTFKW